MNGGGCLVTLFAAAAGFVLSLIAGVIVIGVAWCAAPLGMLLAILAAYAWALWRDCQLPARPAARTPSEEVVPAAVVPAVVLPAVEAGRVQIPSAAVAPRPPYASDMAWRRHAGDCPACWGALWLDGEPCRVGRALRPVLTG